MQLYLKKWRVSAAAHLGESDLALLTEPQAVVIIIDMEGKKLIKIKNQILKPTISNNLFILCLT